MSRILGIQEIDGRAAGAVVDDYYGGMRPDTLMLVLHDDPLRLAYLLSGDNVEPRMSVAEQRALLSDLWLEVENRLAGSDRRDVEGATPAGDADVTSAGRRIALRQG